MERLPTTTRFLAMLKWSDEECRAYLERRRWPDGDVVCPKCGVSGARKFHRLTKGKNKNTTLFRCVGCKRQFSATAGTIFEDSHIPLNKWFAAVYLMCASKKGISAHQLFRMLEIGSYRTAWFMCHRIREAMMDKVASPLTGTIEADETYIGPRTKRLGDHYKRTTIEERQAGAPNTPSRRAGKEVVFGIIERGGRVRTRHIKQATRDTVRPIMRENIDMEDARLITDESSIYRRIKDELPHEIIRHQSEYVRGEIHTQNIEGFWSLLKRGLYGTFHHVDAAYLGKYLDEFEYRFNERETSDGERFDRLMGQLQGRVLWYCQTPQPENPFA